MAVPTHCCILYSTDVSTPRDGLAIGTSKYFDHIQNSYIRFTKKNVMIRTMPQLLILRYYCMVLESTIQN